MRQTPRYIHGFSLVELSIVLVILGLLVGGVLSGQSLIRAAELRAVSTEYSRWATATQTFRDKYFAPPGDMNNATSFWGAAHATPATCLTTAGTGTQTCNGDGDGILDFCGGASQYCEMFTYWQQLASAGLIEGSYTGRAGPLGAYATLPTNAPKAKLSNGLWYVGNDSTSGGALFPIAVARHNFRIGMQNSGWYPSIGIMTPEEMWNLDTKLDDGKPGFGVVTAEKASFGTCSTTSTASTAEYALVATSKVCVGYLGTGF
jgi:prepilin-type N-terminal cleavage/methylation domain-containing protein